VCVFLGGASQWVNGVYKLIMRDIGIVVGEI
jgi:hypothetical protein